MRQPNVLFVFADQWRAQATGYNGDPNVRTPNLDRFAGESVNFPNAVAGCPVCSPYRASLMTGQYPLRHGVFVNDVPISPDGPCLAECFNAAGYATAYIGKWHIDGHARSAFVPPERRLGFEFWQGCECTHNYHHSLYYADTPEKRYWDGYDADAQTRRAQRWIERHDLRRPFLLMLSWGPPHAPYETAPERYRQLYDAERLQLRANVPEAAAEQSREQLAGYYAHITALDASFGDLLSTLRDLGIEDETIVVFTSDHGDMLGSHGRWKKQVPWAESLRVPFLLRYPAAFGREARTVPAVLDAPDVMPTLLGLCGIDVPDSVEGADASPALRGQPVDELDAALLGLPYPFHQWNRQRGGKEYRGVQTARYTYVRDLTGPWLLYDNDADPYQHENLCNDPAHQAVQAELDDVLTRKLRRIGDAFLPGEVYIRRKGYPTNERGDPVYEP